MYQKKAFLLVLILFMVLSAFTFHNYAAENLGKLRPVELNVTCEEFQFNNHIKKSVKLAVHGRLEITLCSNPSTGYEWPDQAQITNHTVLWQTSHTTTPSSSSMIGSPGEAKWTFQALNEGTTTISFRYGRAWESAGADEWTFHVEVTVVDENKPDKESTRQLGEKLVRDLFKDMKSLNINSLKNILSKQFQSIHKSGASDREGELAIIKKLDLGTYSLTDFTVTRDDDALIVTYKVSAEETLQGEKVSQKPTPRLSVFIKTDSGWKWVAHANPS